jgi:hypothetical protein
MAEVVKPRHHLVVKPRREGTLAVGVDPQRLALLDPFLVPGDQIDEKPWIAMGIAPRRNQLVPCCSAPCLYKPNQVFPRGGLNGGNLHGGSVARFMRFVKFRLWTT